MHKISVANRRFVEDYGDVLRHHVECILKSGMILDEDMNLLTTFWDPTLIPHTEQQLVFTSTTFAAAGLIVSLKLQNAYPIALSLIPATIQLLTKAFCSYRERNFKKEFQRLLKVFREIYRLNKEVSLYYSKRDLAVANEKLHMKAYQLLLKPGEDFLKFSIMELLKIIEQLKLGMEKVCDFVPISEGQFICSLELNLDNYKVMSCDSFQEMKTHFTKLMNLYLLVSSNFLGCIGLSMCVQLWKEPCSFRKIFTELLPNMVRVLEASYAEIKSRFNVICFNLCERVTGPHLSNASRTLPSLFVKPLMEFLLNVQITFDKGRHMQLLLEEQPAGCEEFVDVLHEAWKHIEISKDCLQILTRRIDASASREKVNNETLVMPSTQSVEAVETATCDELAELKDEEYNLSIHGSEDYIDYFEDLEDISSNEDFSMLLLELKKKLLEKKGKVQEEIPVKLPPEKIPVVNHSKDVNSLLKNVMLTAQKLNRSEEFQFGFNMFPEIPRPFNTTYRCYSVAMLPGNERQDVERGGKIIMPPSALEQLTRLNINYPMQFKIVNKKTNRTSHCGVLEFVADEGKVYLPLWMMQNLVLEEGDFIQIESVSLPVGTFAKFQPLSPDFLDITNPKAVLENCLRTFSCLTSGDVIAVKYNQRAYELCVLETQPGNAISIIECDMNVEFAAPVGYKEMEEAKPPEEGMAVDPTELMPEPSGFVAFRGQGNRLDGKRRKDSGSADAVPSRPVYVRGIPDYDYQIGILKFLRQTTKSSTSSKEENEAFKAFSGEGFSLKRRD